MGDESIREVFNIEVGRRAYMAFIDRLRNQLRGNRLVGDCPVLPPSEEVSSDPRFEIVLQTNNNNEITLLFRRHDLYLEAYRNGSGTWLEFSTPNQVEHVVQDSEFLGFDGSYVGSHGLEAAAGRGRGRIRLGRDDLHDAVNNLATSNNRAERARSLLVVIQMTAESIRFDDILFFILDNYIEGRGNVPGSLLLELENSWGLLSNSLIRDDAYHIPIFPIHYMDGSTQRFFTREQAIAALGMLLYAVKGIVQTRQPPSVDFAVHGNEGVGRPLVEVFNVVINDIDDENPGDLYGTITVTDGVISQYIYNRERGDAESVRPGDNATLNGPAEACISALDDFIIDVSLMDKDSDLSPDDQVSKGQIEWSSYNSSNAYDVLLYEKFSGTFGMATIFYAVFSDAVQARVEVKLINGDDENPADVYGLLAVTNGKPGFEDNEILLFQRSSSYHVDVQPQQLIPLARSLIAMPLNSELRVRAELYDHDSDWSSDDEIAKGTVNFPAQLSGTSEKTISGKNGLVSVKVTWTP